MFALALTASAALLCAPAMVRADGAAAAAPGGIEEIEITGERAGPRLWKVSAGDHVLWILGTLGPLPKRMTWHSKEVETVLQESQAVLAANPQVSLHAGPFTELRLYLQWRRLQKNTDGESLQSVVPPPLYARVEALKQTYAAHDGRIEELRPMFAARRLYQKAIDRVGLAPEFEIEQAVFALARKHGVRIQQVGLDLTDPKDLLNDLSQTPRAAELQCLDTTVTRLESDIGAMQARARAWALGDVDALRRMPYSDQRDVCWSAISSAPRIQALRTRMTAAWIDAAEAALKQNRSTLALHSMSELLKSDGPLSTFRARGYTVEGP